MAIQYARLKKDRFKAGLKEKDRIERQPNMRWEHTRVSFGLFTGP